MLGWCLYSPSPLSLPHTFDSDLWVLLLGLTPLFELFLPPANYVQCFGWHLPASWAVSSKWWPVFGDPWTCLIEASRAYLSIFVVATNLWTTKWKISTKEGEETEEAEKYKASSVELQWPSKDDTSHMMMRRPGYQACRKYPCCTTITERLKGLQTSNSC